MSNYADRSDWAVCQQAYRADGTAVQAEQALVNSHHANYQGVPKVTALADGDWVVTWMSYTQDGSDNGVYQRTFHVNEKPTLVTRIPDQVTTENAALGRAVTKSTNERRHFAWRGGVKSGQW